MPGTNREKILIFLFRQNKFPPNFAPQVKTELSGSVHSTSDSIAAFHSPWWLEANLNFQSSGIRWILWPAFHTGCKPIHLLQSAGIGCCSRQALGRKVSKQDLAHTRTWRYFVPESGPRSTTKQPLNMILVMAGGKLLCCCHTTYQITPASCRWQMLCGTRQVKRQQKTEEGNE